jgi:hypothetical protein
MTIALLGMPVSSTSTMQGGNWRTYQGAWFEIKYPANFRVRPSLPSSTSSEGYDSVFFSAPDGTVEFYVFSPQWNGVASDIDVNLQTEVVVSQSVTRRAGKSIRRLTIRARDGTYLRSYEDTEDTTTNTRKVFGISYVNTASYNRHKSAYLSFKASLRQYAD